MDMQDLFEEKREIRMMDLIEEYSPAFYEEYMNRRIDRYGRRGNTRRSMELHQWMTKNGLLREDRQEVDYYFNVTRKTVHTTRAIFISTRPDIFSVRANCVWVDFRMRHEFLSLLGIPESKDSK
jgi:hypothetical protein